MKTRRKNSLKLSLRQTSVAIILCLAILMYSDSVVAVGNCWSSKFIASKAASCPCSGGDCPSPVPSDKYWDAHSECDPGYSIGYANCQNPFQVVGKYYTCDKEVDWPVVLGLALGEAGICAGICIITVGAACLECVIAALLLDGELAAWTCVIWKCVVNPGDNYEQPVITVLNGVCPSGG